MPEARPPIRLELGEFIPERRAVVRPDGVEIALTPSEARLLSWLGEHPHEVIGADRLLREVWGYKAESRTVYVTVSRLRDKIEADRSRPRHLLAAASAGYRFEPLPEPAAAPEVEGRRLWGREAELAQVLSLRDAGARRITLTGPGGIGKTTLARAASNAEDVFCDASEARDGAGLLEAIYRALGLAGGGADLRAYLGAVLRARGPLWLVLDNLEQVAEAARDLLDTWRTEVPALAVLATSRVALRAVEERPVVVGPLALPADEERATLAGSPAVALFLERASAARPALRVDAETLGLAAELVRELDGVPLCLHLAAARVRSFSLGDLATRLRNRPLDLLADGERRDRQRTIRATVSWSLDLLPPWGRSSWAALSLLRAPFTLETAEALLDPPLFEGTPWAPDVLECLVDASLIQLQPIAHEGEAAHYTWIQSLRAFAAEQLAVLPLRDTLRTRHMRCFAERWTPTRVARLVNAAGRADRAVIRREQADLSAAWRRAVETREPGALETLTTALGWLGRTEGPPDAVASLMAELDGAAGLPDGVALLVASTAADMAFSLGRAATARPALEQALRHHADAPLAIRFAARQSLVALAEFLGDRAQMHQISEQMVEQDAPQLGPAEQVAAAQTRGTNRLALGDPEGAERDLLDGLRLARASGNTRFTGTILMNLAGLYRDRGEPDRAAPCAREALDIAIANGDSDRAPMAQTTLGKIAMDEGRLGEARACFEAALQALLRLGMLSRAAVVRGNLGVSQLSNGDLVAARDTFRGLVGDPAAPRRVAAAARAYLGEVLLRQGSTTEARTELTEAVEEARASGGAFAEAIALSVLARLELVADPRAAAAYAAAALALASRLDARVEALQARLTLAKAQLQLGDAAAADESLRELSPARLATLPTLPRLELHLLLASLARQRGDASAASIQRSAAHTLLQASDLGPDAPLRKLHTALSG